MEYDWNPTEDYDVVVLGSGAAGLTAAAAAAGDDLRIAVLEKAPQLGGTTALSGGIAWLPANRLAHQADVDDSREQAVRYLAALSLGRPNPDLEEAFVDGIDALLDFLDSTPLRLQLVPGFPDYHPEHPGGLAGGGRSLEPALFSFDTIGPWAQLVAGAPMPRLLSEIPIGGGTGIVDPDVESARRQATLEGLGRGLVGALLAGCLHRGIRPEVDARATRLHIEDGRVRGVEVQSPHGRRMISTRTVVLATGGFEQDAELVDDFLRGPIATPPGAPTNTGDGLRMAARVGARLGNMREAWWVPVVRVGDDVDQDRHTLQLLLRERTLPRSIMVNRRGHRFANEAANYNALGGAFHTLDPTSFDYVNHPAWLVFDQGFVDRYGGFGRAPGASVPQSILRADTLDELAVATGVTATALADTVVRWNGMAEAGIDTDFGRGQSVYDGWCGDRERYPGPRATLGPIDTAPYYAVQVHNSALGTKGGPKTTTDGQVLDVDGRVIDGLYAAGNVMAAPTGSAYGGAGGTIGPAMVFGYKAGRHAAAAARSARTGV